jgi:preprotein translocase SecE subunit
MAQMTSGDRGSAARTRNTSASQAQVDEVEDPPLDSEDEDLLAEDELVDETLSQTEGRAVARASTRAVVERTGAPAWILANPFTRYIYESYIELRKVTWPTRQTTWQLTLVVIAMSAFVAILLGLFDLGLVKLIGYIIGLRK